MSLYKVLPLFEDILKYGNINQIMRISLILLQCHNNIGDSQYIGTIDLDLNTVNKAKLEQEIELIFVYD